MHPIKLIGRISWVRKFAGILAALYIRLVHFSGSWTVVDGYIPAQFWDRDEPFILAVWHGRILMMPLCWRQGVPMRVLISQHRDGELIAGVVTRLGLGTVRGSSRRRGTQAAREILRTLRDGVSVAITPDAPRGPFMRSSLGIITIAQLSGAAIIPTAYSVSSQRVLPTWDRFALPAPCSRGVFIWGKPLRIAKDADPAEARLLVEEQLNALSAKADRLCGRDPVVPESCSGGDSAQSSSITRNSAG